MTFAFAKRRPNAVAPKRGSEGAAGFDLSACEDLIIPAHKWAIVPTGISIQMPNDCYARVAPRSGLTAKHGLDVGAGVIDCDYTGEVGVILFNHADADFPVKAGDRVAQLIFEKIHMPKSFPEVSYDEFAKSTRGEAGFGSTGGF